MRRTRGNACAVLAACAGRATPEGRQRMGEDQWGVEILLSQDWRSATRCPMRKHATVTLETVTLHHAFPWGYFGTPGVAECDQSRGSGTLDVAL